MTTPSSTLLPSESASILESTKKDPHHSQCADPTHHKLPHHIHLSLPCFGHKPVTDPNSTEPHAKPAPASHPTKPPHKKDICPPGTGGEVLGDGDMPIFGDYGISDGGNGIGMMGPYPKGYDPSKPNNGLPPTPLQEWERNVREAQRKAFGGGK